MYGQTNSANKDGSLDEYVIYLDQWRGMSSRKIKYIYIERILLEHMAEMGCNCILIITQQHV